MASGSTFRIRRWRARILRTDPVCPAPSALPPGFPRNDPVPFPASGLPSAPMTLTLDFHCMMAPALAGRGIDPARLEGVLFERFAHALGVFERQRREGVLGFLDLPSDPATPDRIRELADSFGQWFENIVVLGIGGSALGTQLLRDALRGPYWNLDGPGKRDDFPRLFILDNADPATVGGLLERLDLSRTLFNVVSKSGSTAETMAQYLLAEAAVSRAVGADHAAGHFLFTTDPDAGALRGLARQLGVPALDLPGNVGGRFSVLSAVGLLPAAAIGIDIHRLLAGAAAMRDRCMEPDLRANPAGMFAVLLHSAQVDLGMPIHVLMPYSDRLRGIGLWFQQLWAESLGKAYDREGIRVESGPTPLPAIGATDQHAQVQLFMEGPRDKVVVFVRVADPGVDLLEIPRAHGDVGALGYLGGHTLGGLLDAEFQATREALRREGRPSMTIELERLDPYALGEVLMLLQSSTVLAGGLYGVDPLNQPGVELGKELTYGLLGRSGYPVPELPPGNPEWRIGATGAQHEPREPKSDSRSGGRAS